MTLSSTSTYADALSEYKDNLDWEGDTAKARAFRAACRFLLLERPTQNTAADGRAVERESLVAQLQAVTEYLMLHDTANLPRTSFTRARAINDL